MRPLLFALILIANAYILAADDHWKIVLGETVLDPFFDDTIARVGLALGDQTEAMGFKSFVFNQRSSLKSPDLTFFNFNSNYNFDELTIRLGTTSYNKTPEHYRNTSKGEFITIVSEILNKSWAGDYKVIENIFVIYKEQLEAILAYNNDTPIRVTYLDNLRGSVFFDFTVPKSFWEKVASVVHKEASAP